MQEQHRKSSKVFNLKKWIKDPIYAAWGLNLITLAVAIASIYYLRLTIIEDNRAWVAPRTAFLEEPITIDKPVLPILVYENTGRSPALDVSFNWFKPSVIDTSSMVEALKNPLLAASIFGATNCDKAISTKGAAVAWPSAMPGIYENRFQPDPNRPDLENVIATQELVDGEQSLVIKGCVVYKTFEKIRYSSFCFFFQQKPGHSLTEYSSGTQCPVGNDAK